MARNGREREVRDDLRREAAARLAAVKRTAAALEDRLRERTEQVGEVIDRTRDQLSDVDEFVRRHPYLFIGGAIGIGLVLGRRGNGDGRPNGRAARGAEVRYVMVERAHRPGVLRSLVGGVAALALRQGVSWLTHRLARPDEEEDERDRLFLPRGGERG